MHVRCSEERAGSKERVERLVKIYPANRITFRDGAAEKTPGKVSKHLTKGLGRPLNINITVWFIHFVLIRHLCYENT